MGFNHISVMPREVIEGLAVKPDGIYVDGTLGGGGHASEVCRRLAAGRLIGIDQDEAALEAARQRLEQFGDKAVLVRSNFCNMAYELNSKGISKVNGILLDLGVSSYQIDTPDRGFSYMQNEAPLDMRMDRRQSLTAAEILNTYSATELRRIFKDYGEERFAAGIADRIVSAREGKPLATQESLMRLLKKLFLPNTLKL